MLFCQFSNIIIYVKIVGKIQNQHLSVWLFSNPGEKFQILVESTGQINPIVLHLLWTLSPGFVKNHTFKYWSDIFPTILTYIIMLENCQRNISVYGSSPIQGTKNIFLLKFNEARISEWNIYILGGLKAFFLLNFKLDWASLSWRNSLLHIIPTWLCIFLSYFFFIFFLRDLV